MHMKEQVKEFGPAKENLDRENKKWCPEVNCFLSAPRKGACFSEL